MARGPMHATILPLPSRQHGVLNPVTIAAPRGCFNGCVVLRKNLTHLIAAGGVWGVVCGDGACGVWWL